MSDEPKPAEEAAEQVADPKPPEKVTLKHKGSPVEMSFDDAMRYANMGFGYSSKMEGLNKKEQTLAGKEQALSIGEELLRLKDEHPDRAKQIIAIANGHANPVTPQPNGSAAIDEENLTEAEAALHQQNQALRTDITSIRAELQGLGGAFQERQQEELVSRMERDIEKASKSIPGWTSAHSEFYKPQIAALMKASNIDAKEASMMIATGASRLKEAEAQAASDRVETNRRFRTEPPSGGTPRTTPDKVYKKKDLDDGSIVKDVMANLGRYFDNL